MLVVMIWRRLMVVGLTCPLAGGVMVVGCIEVRILSFVVVSKVRGVCGSVRVIMIMAIG